MADPSAPGDRPLRGMIDPALHQPPAGFRATHPATTPDEATAAVPTPTEPTPTGAPPPRADLFGTPPAGPDFRHPGSRPTPAEAPADLAEDAAPADDSLEAPDDSEIDELELSPDTGARPSRVAASVRGRPLRAAVLLLALLVMVSGAGLGVVLFRDARQTYTADEVVSALRGFRAPAGKTQTRPVNGSAAQLDVSPQSCAPLVTQSPSEATDGAQWTSTDGTGYEQVQVLTARFADPATARAVLQAMVDSALDCERVLVRWQDDSPRWVRIRSATSSTGVFTARRELSYSLRSSYGGLVYVRQYGNVIAFVGGIGETESGRRLSDDLIAELKSLPTS